ncbi:hypothetical protein NMG60_11028107 [Bertholletia excelsa]
MARLVQALRRSIGRTLLLHFNRHQLSRQPERLIPSFLAQSWTHSSADALYKSPFESNVLRILRNEILYQSEYAPSHQPPAEFNSFSVEDRPGEQWMTLRGKFGENETIKIEATMFDGSVVVPKSGDDSDAEEMCLHISVLVDISKGKECDLEFVCSAWRDHMEIQKVYIFRRDKTLPPPYMGPNFRDLNHKLQNALLEFLKARGVDDNLSAFLHEFMMNKDRIELLGWLTKVKSFVEK